MADLRTLEQRVDAALKTAEQALLAAAHKQYQAPVTKEEFSTFRIEMVMLLNERLNVNQVPVRLGDILRRMTDLEAAGPAVLGNGLLTDLNELLERVEVLETASPAAPASDLSMDLSAVLERVAALEATGAAPLSPVALPVRQAAPSPPPAPPMFTGQFERGSLVSDGNVFQVKVRFNRPLACGYRDVKDHGFVVNQGRVSGASRVGGHSDYWKLRIVTSSPHGTATVTSTDMLVDKDGIGLSMPITLIL